MSKNSEKQKRWRKNFKTKLVAALGGRCRVCGYNKTSNALHVHHVDPKEKQHSFSDIRSHPISWSRAVVEAKKCILLCANCHSEVHEGILDISEFEIIFIPV